MPNGKGKSSKQLLIGILKRQNGETYTGEFKDGKIQGKGKIDNI